jgi:chromosome segregation ATPase
VSEGLTGIQALRADVVDRFTDVLGDLQVRMTALSDGAIEELEQMGSQATELGDRCEETLLTSRQTLEGARGRVEETAARLENLVGSTPHLSALMASTPAATDAVEQDRATLVQMFEERLAEIQSKSEALAEAARAYQEQIRTDHMVMLEGTVAASQEQLTALTEAAEQSGQQMSQALQQLQAAVETHMDETTAAAGESADGMLASADDLVNSLIDALGQQTEGTIGDLMTLSEAYEAFDGQYGEALGEFLEVAQTVLDLIKAIEPVIELIKMLE